MSDNKEPEYLAGSHVEETHVLVIGSGHARMSSIYHRFIKKTLGVDEFFLLTFKGLVESIAHNNEKDRANSFKLLHKQITSKISTVVVLVDVSRVGYDPKAFLLKKNKREEVAQAAAKAIFMHFGNKHPDFSVLPFIVIPEDYKILIAEDVDLENSNSSQSQSAN